MIRIDWKQDHQLFFSFSGIRYFGLITWPILVCSTILTCFIALLHYDTSTSYSIVLFLLTIHFECLILALVRQLTSIVGGSCVGYALVAPAFEYEFLFISTNSLINQSNHAKKQGQNNRTRKPWITTQLSLVKYLLWCFFSLIIRANNFKIRFSDWWYRNFIVMRHLLNCRSRDWDLDTHTSINTGLRYRYFVELFVIYAFTSNTRIVHLLISVIHSLSSCFLSFFFF